MQTIQTGEIINAYIKSQEKCKQYILGNILGIGTGGIVYESHNIWDESDIIAVKKEKEVFGNTLELYKVMEEKRLDNVVNILFVQEEYGKSYFVGMDKGDGSITELYDEYKNKGLSQQDYMKYIDEMIKQVANGIYSIHANKIIHRDLKPDNIVYKKNGDQNYYMICDLGLAKQQNEVKDEESQKVKLTSGVGTPIYMAPELFQTDKNYDSSVDIWAFGVMIYQLLAKQELFQGKSIQQVQNQILEYKQKDLDDNFQEFKKFPKHYQDLLKMMIVEDPKKRINIKQVLEFLDKEKLEQAYQKYGHAQQFSEWDNFKKKIHPDVKTKILNIQTKLRPLFVNQRDLIYEVLIKIGEDLNKQYESKAQNAIQQAQTQELSSQTMQKSEIQKGILKFSEEEKKSISTHVQNYFNTVKEKYLLNSKV